MKKVIQSMNSHLFHHCFSTGLSNRDFIEHNCLNPAMHSLFIFGGGGAKQLLKLLKNMLTLCLLVKEVTKMCLLPSAFIWRRFHHLFLTLYLLLKEVILNTGSSSISTTAPCSVCLLEEYKNRKQSEIWHLSLMKSLETHVLLLCKALSEIYISFCKISL